ncbi:MAG: hypothetical protein ACRELB_02565, partial [Polyangiaceae bacterium]
SGLCVLHSGDVACPAPYATKHVTFGGVDDSRDCAQCTCGPASGGSCAGSVAAYSSTDGSCSGGAITYDTPVKCDAVAQPADIRVTVTSTPGSCTPSAGMNQGTVTPAAPTTFCCLN